MKFFNDDYVYVYFDWNHIGLGGSFIYNRKTKESFLVDIDLGEEYRITAIGLAPYLKAELFPPDEFELFFWKDGWMPLGRKPANLAGYLVVDNVPQRALLMLKNCRWEGESSEHIFVYEEGTVLWQ